MDDADMEPAGPPVRRRGLRLSSHVPIRFQPEVIERVKALAGHDGVTVSTWIRQAVDRALRESAAWYVPSYPSPTTTENSTPVTCRITGGT